MPPNGLAFSCPRRGTGSIGRYWFSKCTRSSRAPLAARVNCNALLGGSADTTYVRFDAYVVGPVLFCKASPLSKSCFLVSSAFLQARRVNIAKLRTSLQKRAESQSGGRTLCWAFLLCQTR